MSKFGGMVIYYHIIKMLQWKLRPVSSDQSITSDYTFYKSRYEVALDIDLETILLVHRI